MRIQWTEGVTVSKQGHRSLTIKGTVEHDGKEYMKFRTLKVADVNERKPGCKFKAPSEQTITLWRTVSKKEICGDILTQIR